MKQIFQIMKIYVLQHLKGIWMWLNSFGLPNWAFSGESDTLLSSAQTANTPPAVWPNIYAEAKSDNKNESSTSYQQDLAPTSSSQAVVEDSTLPYLESNTVADDIEKAFEFPPFKEKDGGRFTEESSAPIDLSTKLRAMSEIKKLRKPDPPRLKELFGVYMLPVIDPSTGTRVLRPCIVEVQSSKPYENQELKPALSPQEIAAIREAGDSSSLGMDEEMSVADEDMEVSDEGNNNNSDEEISVSEDEEISVSEDEEDEEVNIED